MERVLVIGCSGAGKSTFSRALARKTLLPLIHLDREYWRPGWTEPERDDWQTAVRALVAGPFWVMDGNYGGTFDIRMPAADTIVFFDFPRHVCLRRVVVRALRGLGRTRPDVGQGCPERLDPAFWRYVWTWNAHARGLVLDALDRNGKDKRIAVFRHDRDAAAFLAGVGVP